MSMNWQTRFMGAVWSINCKDRLPCVNSLVNVQLDCIVEDAHRVLSSSYEWKFVFYFLHYCTTESHVRCCCLKQSNEHDKWFGISTISLWVVNKFSQNVYCLIWSSLSCTSMTAPRYFFISGNSFCEVQRLMHWSGVVYWIALNNIIISLQIHYNISSKVNLKWYHLMSHPLNDQVENDFCFFCLFAISSA